MYSSSLNTISSYGSVNCKIEEYRYGSVNCKIEEYHLKIYTQSLSLYIYIYIFIYGEINNNSVKKS